MSKSNDVLVTNTTLVESARLFTRDAHEPNDFTRTLLTRQLIEFCNLAECVVLNDNILSIPGKLPDDVAGSPLIKGLIDGGVLQALVSDEFATNAVVQARRILGCIGNNRVYSEAIDYRYLEDGEEFNQTGIWKVPKADDRLRERNFQLLLNSLEYVPNADKLNLGATSFFGQRSFSQHGPESISAYLDAFRQDLDWNVSPNPDYVVHQIRNVVYWSSAEHFAVSYSPDVFRVDWVRSWLSRWKSSLSEQIYAIVANAFRCQADEVRRDDDEVAIALPPIPAIIAQRSKSQHDVIETLFDLRHDFESFRQSLKSLEEERRRARSIAERRVAMERIKRLFASLDKLSGRPQPAKLSTAFGYGGKLLEVAKDPLNPKAYVSLAEKGADWIQDWWNARPALRLLFMKRRLENLSEYWELSKMLAGVELSDEQVRTFQRYYFWVGATEREAPGRQAISK